MKKLLVYALIIIFAVSLVACSSFTKEQNNNSNTANQEQVSPATGADTVILKGKDLKGVQLTGVDEQGRKLNFQIRDVELDPQDPEKETYLYTVFYLDTSDSNWKNLCKPDAKNVAKAISRSGFLG